MKLAFGWYLDVLESTYDPTLKQKFLRISLHHFNNQLFVLNGQNYDYFSSGCHSMIISLTAALTTGLSDLHGNDCYGYSSNKKSMMEVGIASFFTSNFTSLFLIYQLEIYDKIDHRMTTMHQSYDSFHKLKIMM